MNDHTSHSASVEGPSAISRREAIRRAALLLGVALTPSMLEGVLRAQGAPATGPVHLTARQFATAGAVAERILPRTDTPGARDVGVPAFLDRMAGEFMTPEEKAVFLAGLAEVESVSVAAHARGFTELGAADQDAVLRRIAKAAEGKQKTFFHQVRELTLIGYFTSEAVGRNVLHYDPIPGPFQGCIPLADVGNRAWTR